VSVASISGLMRPHNGARERLPYHMLVMKLCGRSHHHIMKYRPAAHHLMNSLPHQHQTPWFAASLCAYAGALLVGVAAGVISVVAFAFLTPLLERVIGLGDTCGVHNLHGIPGVLGGLVRRFPLLAPSMEAATCQHAFLSGSALSGSVAG